MRGHARASAERELYTENFTATVRADEFALFVIGQSSGLYLVSATKDPQSAEVRRVQIERQPGLINMPFQLPQAEVAALMAAVDNQAGEYGGNGVGPWAPEDEDLALNAAWGRVIDFRQQTELPDPPVEEALQSLQA